MDKKINVVTGATGHIGFALCVELKRRGEYVRALYKTESLASKAIQEYADEVICCDVTDKAALLAVFDGADVVYHLAGIISISSKMTNAEREVNVDGTKNVCEACVEKGVRRLVYTSSVHALDFKNTKEILFEKTGRYCPERVHGGYAKSKAEATNIVLDFVEKGLDAVITLPSGVVGEYEYRRSNFGQMIVDVAERKLPAYVTGRYDFVDVKDVATALADLSALGVKGESYNISGSTITVKQVIQAAAEGANVKPPKLCMPNFLVRFIARFIERRAIKRGELPTFTPYSMRVLKDNCNFSHEKLTALTGYSPRNPLDAIKEQSQFYLNVIKVKVE